MSVSPPPNSFYRNDFAGSPFSVSGNPWQPSPIGAESGRGAGAPPSDEATRSELNQDETALTRAETFGCRSEPFVTKRVPVHHARRLWRNAEFLAAIRRWLRRSSWPTMGAGFFSGAIGGIMAAAGRSWAPAVIALDWRPTMKDLVVLTRDGCRNTAVMRANLDAALTAQGWPSDYLNIDIGKLPAGDVRTGYPTPTLLYKGRDLFGMPVPQPPYDVPS